MNHADRYEWERILRRAGVSSTTKLVALMMSTYANRDGTRVFPGVARLSATCNLSERAVRKSLTELRELELIERTRKGSSLGRQAMTDEHRLAFPDDLAALVHLLDPDESTDSRPCSDLCRHPRTAAPGAGDNSGSAKEHRHLVPRTPAPRSGTPAPDDRNTGTTCTPPTHYQPVTNPLDQREDQVRDSTTDGWGPETSNVIRLRSRGA